MNLGIFLSPGDSLLKQKKSGQLDRLIKYYLTPYSKHFTKVYLFTYGSDKQISKLPSNIILVTKPKFIPYKLYQFLIPFLYPSIVKKLDVIRIFQAIGGLPLLLINKPFVVTYGYRYDQFAKIENQPLKATIIKILIKPILKKAFKIIVTSDENQKYITKLGFKNKISFIPNGVDPVVFKPRKTQSSDNLILTVGRLTIQKNHRLLINSISQSKHRSKIKLVIIGTGSLKKDITKLAMKHKVNLTILKNLPHRKLASQYQKATIFCLTSSIEGHSKTLLEAMSSSCACLTTNFAGNLIQEGKTGMIADNAEKLSEKIDTLLINQKLRLQLGRSARKEILKSFDLKQLIKKEIKLLHQTAKQ